MRTDKTSEPLGSPIIIWLKSYVILFLKDPWPVQKNNLFQFRNRRFLVYVFACWFASRIRLEKFPFRFDFDHSVEIMDGVNFLAFRTGLNETLTLVTTLINLHCFLSTL